MRGEDETIPVRALEYTGSPPHARGRHTAERACDYFPGITPACAGKTSNSLGRYRAYPDHPRMRGEDSFAPTAPSSTHGSPPHARGRQAAIGHVDNSVRITPACAGKTATPSAAPSRTKDHPRMRGEDILFILYCSMIAGSPPHARGRLTNLLSSSGKKGITPACAGKTVFGERPECHRRDHPRMRGEDLRCRS